jgi:hypothetical protein
VYVAVIQKKLDSTRSEDAVVRICTKKVFSIPKVSIFLQITEPNAQLGFFPKKSYPYRQICPIPAFCPRVPNRLLPDQTFVVDKHYFLCLFLELASAALALRVGRDGGRERGLGGDLGDVVERLAVGFPHNVVGGLGVEDAADGFVVEELGAAEDERVLETGDGDFFGLWCVVSMGVM